MGTVKGCHSEPVHVCSRATWAFLWGGPASLQPAFTQHAGHMNQRTDSGLRAAMQGGAPRRGSHWLARKCSVTRHILNGPPAGCRIHLLAALPPSPPGPATEGRPLRPLSERRPFDTQLPAVPHGIMPIASSPVFLRRQERGPPSVHTLAPVGDHLAQLWSDCYMAR